jgi:hypothetical protein
MTDVPQVLIPFRRTEAFRDLPEAAAEAGRGVSTMRLWCEQHHVGRRIGGRWEVSRVALRMFLHGDDAALRLYLAGERSGVVSEHYAALGLLDILRSIQTEIARQNQQELHGAARGIASSLAAKG